MKNIYILTALFIGINILIFCKKDQLNIDREKTYVQNEPQPIVANSYFGGWYLTLYPDGVADINPGGDIVYRGTYKISGSSLKIKIEQDSYKFRIISSTKISYDKYNMVLQLKN